MLLVESLSAAYGQSRVLSDVSLDVSDGSVVCLMGRNGVGKTTLMKSVMGLMKARTGKITFQENNMTNWSPHQRARAGIGYVPQGRLIFPFLTIHENLLMGLEAVKGNARRESAGRTWSSGTGGTTCRSCPCPPTRWQVADESG